MSVSFGDIEAALRRLDGIVKPTPIMTSTTLDRMIGARVLIKPENLQKTGSFKIRGAFNRVAAMTEAEKKRGVVAASAGNHGQALAWAATRAGVNATIVMPRTAAIAKIAATPPTARMSCSKASTTRKRATLRKLYATRRVRCSSTLTMIR
jgi:threonine dehydratase